MTEKKTNGKEEWDFPKVYRYRDGSFLEIIYKNRVELYKLDIKQSGKQITEEWQASHSNEGEEWTPYHEIECLTNNGYRQVKYATETEVV